MSRIGKLPVGIPKGVTVAVDGNTIRVVIEIVQGDDLMGEGEDGATAFLRFDTRMGGFAKSFGKKRAYPFTGGDNIAIGAGGFER